MLKAGLLALCLILGAASPGFAQPSAPLPPWATQKKPVKRFALIIGVSDYDTLTDLASPKKDVVEMSRELKSLGFDLKQPKRGLGRDSILDAIDDLAQAAAPGDLVLVYYSGHGVERSGVNYVVPSDGYRAESNRAGHVFISVDYIMSTLAQRQIGLGLIILDACRDDPFPPQNLDPHSLPSIGLAPPSLSSSAFVIGFASAPRTIAQGRLMADRGEVASVFTRTLVKFLPKDGWSITEIWAAVGGEVSDLTEGRQVPWINQTLVGDVRLKPRAQDLKNMEDAWRLTAAVVSPAVLATDLRAYIRRFPLSEFTASARQKLGELDQQSRIANRTDIAAETVLWLQTPILDRWPIYGGVVTSPGFRYPGKPHTVGLRKQVDLFQAPDLKAAKYQMIAGSELEVLGFTKDNVWALLRTPDGVLGYSRGIETLNRSIGPRASSLSFQPGAQEVDDLSAIAEHVAAAKSTEAKLLLRVGAGSETDRETAQTTAYMRALRLRARLVADGLPADRVSIELPDQFNSGIAADTIQVLAIG